MEQVNTPLSERADAISFCKTITETDVYMFAGTTGDFAQIHVNAEYAKSTKLGERVAHAALIVGLMSTAAGRYYTREGIEALSYGYDKVRFLNPVRFGDTITVTYAKVDEIPDKQQIIHGVEAHNQNNDLVAVAKHIMWVGQS